MRELSLDQLRTLATVVELGSFSAAAKRLHLSQPAVSLQIRELEMRFGLALVERLGKKAFATSAGHDLIAHAGRLLDEAERTRTTMRRHKDGWLGRVRIGTGAASLTYLLPPVLRRLRSAHPTLEIAIRTGGTEEIVDAVVRNDLDIGLVTLPANAPLLDVEVVHESPVLALFPARLAPRGRRVTAQDFARHPYIAEHQGARIAQLAHDWLVRNGVAPRPAIETDSSEAIKKLVAAGLGAALLPQEAVTAPADIRGLATRPLAPPLTRALGVIRRRDKPDDPALRIVRDALAALKR